MAVRQYIGNRYVPIIAGEWSNQNTYESLSIVTHEGNSYTSKQNVPVGIDIANSEYWVQTGNYDANLVSLVNRVGELENKQDTTDTEISTINGKVDNVTSQIETINQNIVDVENSVENVENKLTVTDKAIVVLDVSAIDTTGATDVTTSIQNFVTQNAGKYVIIPRGNYKVKTINVPSNTTIDFNGGKLVYNTAYSADAMVINSTNGSGGYNGAENITIKNCIFDGNYGQLSCVAFGHAKNIKIINCQFINLGKWHFIEVNSSYNVLIKDCVFDKYGYTGATSPTTATSEMIQLDAATNSTAFPWFGPYDNTPPSKVVICDCCFNNTGNGDPTGSNYYAAGIGNHNGSFGSNLPNDILITGCTFDNLNYGIIMVGGENVTITDCKIRAFTGIKLYYDQFNNISINGNILEGYGSSYTASNPDGRGISVNDTGTQNSFVINNLSITNNKVNNFTEHGISPQSYNGTVTGNIVTGCGKAGIYCEYRQQNFTFSGNSVINNNKKGYAFADIYLQSNYAKNCVVSGNSGGTLKAVYSATDTLVTGNTLLTSADFGNSLHANNVVAGSLQ